MSLQVRHWRDAAAVLLMAFCMSSHAAPREEAIQEVQKLNEQALKLCDQGKHQQAMPLAQRAVAVSEKALGPQHPETASSLDALAQAYVAKGDFTQAKPLHLRALEIRERMLGPAHSKTGESLNNLAILYLETGAYAKAEPLAQRALLIFQKALGPEHPKTADPLYVLAILYTFTGAYAKAEPLFQRALAIREKALGPLDPKTAVALNGLALLYMHFGDYTKAEPLYQRVLVIREQAFGPAHPTVAYILQNLAILYFETGAYAKAESLYQRALVIFEKSLGAEHPMTGEPLGGLARVYSESGAYAKAEPLFIRALAIREKTLGLEHPRTGALLTDLANLYVATGAYAKAEPLLQRALAISQKAVGPEHPDTTKPLNSLANLYRATGAYTKAEPLFQRALALWEKARGPEHPGTAEYLNDLANLYSAAGTYAKAEPLYQRAQGIQARNSARFLLTGSESRKQAYLQEVAKSTHRDVSFSVSVRSPGSTALGLTSVLQYKGRVLDEVSGSVARLRRSVKAADRELFDQLAQVATQSSTLTYQGLGNLSPAQYRQRLDELSRRQETLEADLAKRSVEFRRQVTPVTIAAVRRAIPVGAVLIEWFRYRPFDPKATRLKTQQGSPRYAAYVLTARGAPILVDIGDAQVIETSVREFLQALQNPFGRDAKTQSQSLSDQIIKPLFAYFEHAERVLISPDGMLNLVPMAALLDDNGQYLVQRFELTYLTSGRDLLRKAGAASSMRGTVVIADPDFGKPIRLLPSTDTQRSLDLDRSGMVFRPLPSTASEAQGIKSLLKLDDSNVLMRIAATESYVKQLQGPRILHLATHGFFLRDQDVAGIEPMPLQALHNAESPLLRSGVALAGANTRRSGASDDGILTALEAAQLDLRGTELVVLSACESGVGQVQNGEGVYGLRRALFIAGAQTQITSLWKVADQATATLMVEYYQRLLKGEGRSGALRASQQKMLATPLRSHPYWWASFVPIGDWAPLAAQRQ